MNDKPKSTSRSHKRYDVNLKCVLYLGAEQVPQRATIVNMSRQGVGIDVPEQFYFSNLKLEPAEMMIYVGETRLPPLQFVRDGTLDKTSSYIALTFSHLVPWNTFLQLLSAAGQKDLMEATIFFSSEIIQDEVPFNSIVDQLARINIFIDACNELYVLIMNPDAGAGPETVVPDLLYLELDARIQGAVVIDSGVVLLGRAVHELIQKKDGNTEEKAVSLTSEETADLNKQLQTTLEITDAAVNLFKENSEELRILQEKVIPAYLNIVKRGVPDLKLSFGKFPE